MRRGVFRPKVFLVHPMCSLLLSLLFRGEVLSRYLGERPSTTENVIADGTVYIPVATSARVRPQRALRQQRFFAAAKAALERQGEWERQAESGKESAA